MSGRKTEHPTPKRLREARRKGRVAKSVELASASLLLGIALSLSMFGPRIAESLLASFRQHIEYAYAAPTMTVDSAAALLAGAIRITLGASAPLLAVGALTVAVVLFLQIGPLFSTHPISVDSSALDPFKNVSGRFFSSQTLHDLFKAVLKVSIVAFALCVVAQGSLRDIGLTIRQPVEATAVVAGRLLYRVTLGIGGMLLALGVLDLLLQRRKLFQDLRMTKEEVLWEQRQQEGDPRHKAARKRLWREILSVYRGGRTPDEERAPAETASRSSSSAGGNPGAQ